MPVVAVTGAGGFIGGALLRQLADAGHRVRAVVRRPPAARLTGVEYFECRDVAALHEWEAALEGADAVVDLVARVHAARGPRAGVPALQRRERRLDAGQDDRLIHACAARSVRRLVYISTIKVNGEATGARAFTADDEPSRTREPYARAKRETEAALFGAGRKTGVEVVVIRPPMVYGPGVKGNFLSVMRAVSKEWPLPFASISNARSLVSVFNLCDLIGVCLVHPEAADEVFLVCDGEDVSTPGLVRLLAAAVGRRARLVPCPVGLLRLAGALFGQGDRIGRLCGDLRVDMGKTRRLLGWKPPLALAEGIERTADAFARGESRGRTKHI